MGATLTPPQTVAAFTPLATHSPLQKAEQLPRCWNGSDASLLSELPRLSGEAALRQCPWKARVELAFESFDHCRIQAAHSTKTTKAECPLLGESRRSAIDLAGCCWRPCTMPMRMALGGSSAEHAAEATLTMLGDKLKGARLCAYSFSLIQTSRPRSPSS